MKKILLLTFAIAVITGCSSKPPVPPEPSGPLVKVNSQQPHSVFGGK